MAAVESLIYKKSVVSLTSFRHAGMMVKLQPLTYRVQLIKIIELSKTKKGNQFMKLFNFFLLRAIFIFFSSPFARAVTVKPLNLQQLTRMAPRIVQVTLDDKQVEYDDEESGRLVVYYTFKVNECIKGTCSDHLTIKQIAQGTSAEGPVTARINLGLPEYDVGKTYLLFLANDSPRTGMTAPMGVYQGHFPMEKQEDKWVIPGLHTR